MKVCCDRATSKLRARPGHTASVRWYVTANLLVLIEICDRPRRACLSPFLANEMSTGGNSGERHRPTAKGAHPAFLSTYIPARVRLFSLDVVMNRAELAKLQPD